VFWLLTIAACAWLSIAVLVCVPSAQNVIGNVKDEAIAMRVESLIDESLNKVDTPLGAGGRQRRLGVAEAPNQNLDCMNPFYELTVLISH
jgi:hypothetical protein